jgi:sortase A
VSDPKHHKDLSERELRLLLLDKHHESRQKRLGRFRRTGRAIQLAPDLPPAALDEWRTQPPLDEQTTDSGTSSGYSSRKRWFDRLLLGIEILAVLGLAGILFNGI